MKNAAIILGSLSLICTLAVGCNPKQTNQAPSGTVSASSSGPSKLAYVNVDTLEAKYELLKTKREEFKNRQEQMENELQASYSEMQNDANEVQKKAQANTLTQSEYQDAEKRLTQMQKSLESRKQSLTEQLMKEQDDFNKDLRARLDAFIEEYNKDKHFDFVFTYTASGSQILYANKALDITKDVIDGMNAASKSDEKKKNK